MLPIADKRSAFRVNISRQKYFKEDLDMNTPNYYEYRIKSGESLSLIIAKFYGIGPRSMQYP